MSDIGAFLIARIEDDRADTFELVPYRCEPGCCAPAGWVGHRCLICGTEECGGTAKAITDIAHEHAESIHRRSRVLAECESKRRIVTLMDHVLEAFADREHGLWPDVTRRERDHARLILDLLAHPYADHPDHDPEWAL